MIPMRDFMSAPRNWLALERCSSLNRQPAIRMFGCCWVRKYVAPRKIGLYECGLRLQHLNCKKKNLEFSQKNNSQLKVNLRLRCV